MKRLRLCVLASGGGTNLQALIDARDSGSLDIEFGGVICNVPSAAALDRARAAAIPVTVLDHRDYSNRNDFDRALAMIIAACQPDWVVLAGFMRIIGPAVLQPFSHRMINLHPSLLPLYKGTGTYQRALDAGDSEHGASIHFVTGELDGGTVISQVRIPIRPGDDAESLRQRLAPEEHRLICATIEFLGQHRVSEDKGILLVDDEPQPNPWLLTSDGGLRSGE